MSDTKRYGVAYGVVGSPDMDIDGPYDTPEDARAAYDPDRRVVHVTTGVDSRRVLAGADLVELEPESTDADDQPMPPCPARTIETIQAETPVES